MNSSSLSSKDLKAIAATVSSSSSSRIMANRGRVDVIPKAAGEVLVRRKQQQQRKGRAAALPRDARQQQESTAAIADCKIQDLDEQIRRLEAELEKDEDSSSSSSDSDSESESSGSDSTNEGSTRPPGKVKDEKDQEKEETVIICQSAVQNERIEKLPSHCLPSSKRRFLKIDTSGHDEMSSNNKKQNKTSSKEPPTPNEQKVSSGLEMAVQQVLDGYVARSSERLPFYCRYCQQQLTDEVSFLAHQRTSEFHKTAVEMERKRSYCKLCRKQLTSIVQLHEHLSSKPHKERLQQCKNRQQQQQQVAAPHQQSKQQQQQHRPAGKTSTRQQLRPHHPSSSVRGPTTNYREQVAGGGGGRNNFNGNHFNGK